MQREDYQHHSLKKEEKIVESSITDIESQKNLPKLLNSTLSHVYDGPILKKLPVRMKGVGQSVEKPGEIYINKNQHHLMINSNNNMLNSINISMLPLQSLDFRNVSLKGVNLVDAKLEGARFWNAQLEGAKFGDADLKEAKFWDADVKEANFRNANLERTDFRNARVEGANFRNANLEKANFRNARVEGAKFWDSKLEGAIFGNAKLKGSDFGGAKLGGANFREADLRGASFRNAKLEGADFRGADLRGASFKGTKLEGASFDSAKLEGASFEGAQLKGVSFKDAQLIDKHGVGPYFADAIGWDDVFLAHIDWSQIIAFAEEVHAKKAINMDGKRKYKYQRLEEYRTSVRTYRQLATALEGQGLKEEAERFAYQAHSLQRMAQWWAVWQDKQKLGKRLNVLSAYLFSLLLSLLTGYGYRFGRSMLSYICVMVIFMFVYFYISHYTTHPLDWLDALILSISNMVGRGFFRQDISLSDPFAGWSVLEGIIGVFMDVLLISTLTQRLFKK